MRYARKFHIFSTNQVDGQLRQFGRFIPSPVAMEAIADGDMADSAVDLR